VTKSLALLLTGLLVLTGCSRSRGRACDGLVYTEMGIDTRQYLPCASHILDTMRVLDQHLESYGAGKDASRFDAMGTMTELRKLLEGLGGTVKLRRRWVDAQMTDLNDALCTAYEVYYIEAYGLRHPDKRFREYSAHNHDLTKRYANEAWAYYANAVNSTSILNAPALAG